MNIITGIKPLLDFNLELTYKDGEKIVIDFKPVIAQEGVFAQLSDPQFFRQVKIGEQGRYIEWPGGIDFCADALRSQETATHK